MDQRKHERYDSVGCVAYTEIGEDLYNNAMMSNYSIGGMFFNTRNEVAPGTKICVRMIGYRSAFNAKVVRCIGFKDISGVKYGVGIQYLEEVSAV